MYVRFPFLGVLLNHDLTIRQFKPKESRYHASKFDSLFVKQNDQVRAVVDVELFRGNVHGLIKV